MSCPHLPHTARRDRTTPLTTADRPAARNRRDRAISMLDIARPASRTQRAAPATKAATTWVACRSSDWRARSSRMVRGLA
jgi:hypothetical protein